MYLSTGSSIRLVIIHEHGSLGNQLFQYAAIKRIAPQAKVLFIGLESLKRFLKNVDDLSSTILGKSILTVLKILRIDRSKLIAISGRKKIFSKIEEFKIENRCLVHLEKGEFIPSIAILQGFFQDPNNVDGLDSSLFDINPTTMQLSNSLFNPKAFWARKHTYFVHVRRGDYMTWPSPESPAVLPHAWYEEQIAKIRKIDSSAQFIVFSNDLAYVRNHFSGTPDIAISNQNEFIDLAAMALCAGGGILSASSFSWWAAYYVRFKNPEAHFIAPRFWAGWRQSKWYPGSIQTAWLDYSDVTPH